MVEFEQLVAEGLRLHVEAYWGADCFQNASLLKIRAGPIQRWRDRSDLASLPCLGQGMSREWTLGRVTRPDP
jgi:hypothetical protein